MDSATGWTLFVLHAMLMSQCLGVTYHCPYRSGGVNYPQFNPYNDGVRVGSVTSMKFQTKGKNDAHILLQYDRNNYNSKVIEVVLGGWGNSKSVIRDRQQGSPKSEYRATVLSQSSYRWFWISWTSGHVKVGKGDVVGSSQIMSWNGLSHDINGVRVSYGYGSDGYFIFEQAVNGDWSDWGSWSSCSVTCAAGTQSRQRACNDPAPYAGGADCAGNNAETKACNLGVCPSVTYYCPFRSGGVNYPQFDLYSDNIRVDTTTSFQFQTKGKNDAHILLQYDRNNYNSKVIEVVLGGWGNSKSVIRDRQQGSPKAEYRSAVLSQTAYRWFWISWEGGHVKVGRGETVGSDTIMSWNGLTHDINGVRISYGYSSDGYYIFYKAVAGGWSTWSTWGSCSQTCGSSSQTRSRSCNNPTPEHGGADCGSDNEETRTCSVPSCAVDGGWGSWSTWNTCTVTCAGGTQGRTRSCDSPAAQHGGADCVGDTSESQACNTLNCPINGDWGSWSTWDTCTVTCAGGTQGRTRSCDSPAAQHGGADCVGDGSESQACNTLNCPIDGEWGSWSTWDTCTVTCAGGTQGRTRSCDSPAAQHGGSDCVGDTSESQACNTLNCPINGDWTDWGAWSSCGVTCSDTPLHVTRERSCTNPTPQYNGADCAGDETDTKVCDIDPCPVDGMWGSWARYGTCSVTCEGGVRDRTRLCDDPAPAWGGADCVGVSSETGVCNENGCDEMPPVDGNWGTWGGWQGCSVTCGTGVTRRYRECDSPAPEYNGLPCGGDRFEENSCSGGSACPVAVDGSWSAWSTAVSCTATCGTGTSTRVRLCDSPVPSNGGRQCIGEAMVVESCTAAAPCGAGNSSNLNGYGDSYVSVCPNGYFTCSAGYVTCISEVFRCDCEDDCVDGSDENEFWAGCTAEEAMQCNSANGIHCSGLVTGSLVLILVVNYLRSLYH